VLDRALRQLARITVTRPVLVLVCIGVASAALAAVLGRLQLRTDLVDLVSGDSESGRLQREAIRSLGYGNQFFLVVEGPSNDADAEAMEAAADRLSEEMRGSGYFRDVRSGMSEPELMEVVRFYTRNFPAFADPAARDRIASRLSPAGIRDHVRQGVSGFLTPFSTTTVSYFVADPLGLVELIAPEARLGSGFAGFDMEWGSGGRFFSRDHRGLLVLATPRAAASDYEFAVHLVQWVRRHIEALEADRRFADARIHVVPAGAQVYAEQNRRLVQENIRTASLISVLGNLVLVVAVYRWFPAIVLTILPTSLALLWTTGLVALYPGVVNLVSLAFIAVLAGLGDDQVTYFFSRVPEERARGLSVDEAVATTYLTTGKSVLFCVLTTSTGTLALALARFPALAELGLILTIGLLMLAVHTLVTVPALMALWFRFFPGGVSGPPFRLLPSVARRIGVLVTARPALVLWAAVAILAASSAGLLRLRITPAIDAFEGAEATGVTGQRLLSERFGLEGTPTVLLLEGSLPSVLRRAELVEAALREHGGRDVRSIVSPSALLPSEPTQQARRAALDGVDPDTTARALASSLAESGVAPDLFQPAIAQVKGWRDSTLSLADLRRSLPAGLPDSAIAEVSPGRFVGAVTVYSSNPIATAALSPETLAALDRAAGPVVEFSYDRVGRDLHDGLVTDSRAALAGTFVGVVAIVLIGFRKLKPAALALAPIAFSVIVTYGLLALAGHTFSAMALFAIPLMVGIGIDNGIHLVRRHLEHADLPVRHVVASSGAAVIQTNLTTIVGFGALMSSSFRPLAEMGLIVALGVACTLVASLSLIPALLARGGNGASASTSAREVHP
jgi:uncharacterized protein